MKNLTVTVNGVAYQVTVEENGAASAPAPAPAATAPAAAPAPPQRRLLLLHPRALPVLSA